MNPLHLAVTLICTAYSAAQIVRFIVWLDTPNAPRNGLRAKLKTA